MFDGVTNGMMLRCTGSNFSNFTICMVLYANWITGNPNNMIICTEGAWSSGFFYCSLVYTTMCLKIGVYISTNTGNGNSSTLVSGQPIILIMNISISSGICSISCYINGGNAQVITPFSVPQNTINLTNFDIGGYNNDPPRTFYGGISSLITYNSVLTTAQRQLIEGHLAWKWFVAGSVANPLPSTHPYYSVKI